MNENKSSSYRRLQERVKKLEQELKKTRSNSRQKLKTTEKRLAEALNKQYSISARISNIRAMIDMPQLFLDRDWNIIGYSD
ncbi:MAG: hypothetical protein U9P14_04105, partial [Gemmatimonadota bacterium]|nr:hypothetical protein [Gemmatimonadota bacterium]